MDMSCLVETSKFHRHMRGLELIQISLSFNRLKLLGVHLKSMMYTT
jgi:hypothetical protein